MKVCQMSVSIEDVSYRCTESQGHTGNHYYGNEKIVTAANDDPCDDDFPTCNAVFVSDLKNTIIHKCILNLGHARLHMTSEGMLWGRAEHWDSMAHKPATEGFSGFMVWKDNKLMCRKCSQFFSPDQISSNNLWCVECRNATR